ncbi:MAG: SDR family NAD(P)-dependent oxidoreductase [Pseudomonadota bacterium]
MTYSIEMLEEFDCSRTAEDAFYYIADFSRIDEWDHTIVAAEKVTAGAVGQGTVFDLVYKRGRRKLPIRYEVSEYEEFTRLVMVGEAQNFTATDTVTIKETDNGCHVSWRADIEFRGVAAKIVPFIAGKVKKAGKQTIKDLAIALEDDYPTPSAKFTHRLADAMVLPGVAGFTKYGYQHARKKWLPITANIRGKNILITGATSGLGLASAKRLAAMGASLILVGRDTAKTEEVVKSIQRQTGNKNVDYKIADLSLLAEVSELAEQLLSDGNKIDVLINNAGALLNPRQETSEGIEKSLALLLLSPYLLTTKIQPLLKKAGSARVINVSSGGMYAKRISLSNIESTAGEYSGAEAYARAKRGLVIAGEEWSKDWAADGITVHNMHPGWAQTPGVETGLPDFSKRMAAFLRDSDQGADTIVWLAAATEVAKTTGLFWLDRVPHTTHLLRKTKETAEQRDQLLEVLNDYTSKYA